MWQVMSSGVLTACERERRVCVRCGTRRGGWRRAVRGRGAIGVWRGLEDFIARSSRCIQSGFPYLGKTQAVTRPGWALRPGAIRVQEQSGDRTERRPVQAGPTMSVVPDETEGGGGVVMNSESPASALDALDEMVVDGQESPKLIRAQEYPALLTCSDISFHSHGCRRASGSAHTRSCSQRTVRRHRLHRSRGQQPQSTTCMRWVLPTPSLENVKSSLCVHQTLLLRYPATAHASAKIHPSSSRNSSPSPSIRPPSGTALQKQNAGRRIRSGPRRCIIHPSGPRGGCLEQPRYSRDRAPLADPAYANRLAELVEQDPRRCQRREEPMQQPVAAHCLHSLYHTPAFTFETSYL